MPELHAKFGPSGMKSREKCPFNKGYEGGPSTAADEGTMLHEIVELYVRTVASRRKKPKPGEVTLTPVLTTMWNKLNDEQRGAVEIIIDHIYPILTRPNSKAFAEIQVDVAGITWGTCDLAVLVDEYTVIARDWKFGQRAVDRAYCNAQAWCYVVGIFNRWPQVRHVEFGFLQPRLDDEADIHIFNRDQLPEMVDRASKAVVRSSQAEKEVAEVGMENIPAEDLPDVGEFCEFCSRKLECAKFKQFIGDITDSNLLDMDPDFKVPQSLDTPEERGEAQLACILLSKYVDDLKTTLVRLWEEAGLEAEGFNLISVNGRKTIPAKNRLDAFKETIRGACGEEAGDALLEAMETILGGDFKKIANATDFTLSKLPGPAMNALLKADLVKERDGYCFLKKNQSRK